MNAVRWFARARGWSRSASRLAALALLVLCSASIAGAAIEAPEGIQITPPRLAFLEGDVLFWRPGGGWEAAQVNLPLAAGDAVATRDGKLELQVGGKSFIRAAEGTTLRLKSNEPDFLQLELSAGHVAIDVRDLPRGHSVEVDTSNATVAIARDGYYRVDADAESTRVTARRGGQAAVTPSGGGVADVATGDSVEISGTSDARLSALAAPPFDDWDRWNYDRADRFLAAPRSYAVSSDVYGADDLERYGSWRYVNTYGRVWAPTAVSAGWAPYTDGRWIWDPLYGWSWVDYAPWGWAPYHYGRWVYAGYWAWAPGPVLAAPFYSPALVAFFGGPGLSVGIGVPFVSWVALGWGEPLIPWWGPVGFIGRPCWWGWGGPRVVNNIVINNNTVVNANSINFWRNVQTPGAVVGVPKDQFDTRSIDRVRLAGVTNQGLKPVVGPLPVAAKGVAAGAGGTAAKMPMPNLTGTRPMGETRGGAPANFARQGQQPQGQQPLAAQRSGPPLTGASKGGAPTSAFDALRARGPGALTAPAPRSTDMSRGAAPPPVPGASKNTGANPAFDALRSRGAPAPPRNVGKTGSSVESVGRLRSAPPPVNQFRRSSEGSGTRSTSPAVRSSAPPPVNQFTRSSEASGTRGTSSGVGSSKPPAVPRRLAEAERPSSGWSKPAAPAMRAFRSPSGGASAPATSAARPSFSHAPSGGAPAGSMSRGSAGISNFSHSSGMRSGGFGGGKLGR